jgi:hypothetical protein
MENAKLEITELKIKIFGSRSIRIITKTIFSKSTIIRNIAHGSLYTKTPIFRIKPATGRAGKGYG